MIKSKYICEHCGKEVEPLKGYSRKSSLMKHEHSCSQCEYCGEYGYLYGIWHHVCPTRDQKKQDAGTTSWIGFRKRWGGGYG